ncbi:MAG: RtcB family protein, partial [Deltaproteobacteria bacterium]
RLDLARHRLKLDKAALRMRSLDDAPDADENDVAKSTAGLMDILTADGLGTIGGGNHFCELQVVEAVFDDTITLKKGDLCLLVHTGSRGHGARIFNALSESWAEGFLPDTHAARDYIALHDAAVRWARLNRRRVAERAASALRCALEPVCDAVHNHVQPTGAFWLHRKGAAASDNGLVPLAGSRESLSYLMAVPEGPPESLGSVSHGAGRRYDRSSMHGRIRKTRSDLAALKRNPFGGIIICDDRDLLIEEAGRAYKNASDVLGDLEYFGLAQPLAALAPLITFKTARAGGES